ncbi:MAG: HAMP domain-containing histidine kinase [Nitrospinae bacterium]|nr:HAMP domain-containing histidine kinase [Nitrospinota bacterium]
MNKETLERQSASLSIVTHDLKSPMVAIIGCSRFLLRDMRNKPHDPNWLLMVERMVRAGEGMLELIETILAMGKMEAGKEHVEPAWTADLAGELRETAKTFEYEAGAKNIRLSVDTRTPLPPVFWDMMRLRHHVFNNIISNALKFTPAGGSVTLSVEQRDNLINIRVADTGPGIAPEEREKIFSRFEQGSMTSKRVFNGAGLGLYNARLFVDRHGGTIAVEDSREKGTVILISLPLVKTDATAPAMA